MRLYGVFTLAFGLLIAAQAVGGFNVCRNKDACNPDSECCGRNCMPLLRSDCSQCSEPPCHCLRGACVQNYRATGSGSDRALVLETGHQKEATTTPSPDKGKLGKWPDLLLIFCFAAIIIASLVSGLLWAYLTFRDTKKLQVDDAMRKLEHRKGLPRSASRSSLRVALPIKRVSSKSSKEVVKA